MKVLLKKFESRLADNISVFVIFLISMNVIIVKIPIHRLFIGFYEYDVAKNIERSIHGFIIIVGSIFLIKRMGLTKLSGIRFFRIDSPWLLLIPFIYPMGLGYYNFSGMEWNEVDLVAFSPVFIAILLKGMAEEYAFRGLLLSYLIKKLNPKKSLFKIICLSAIFFALMHMINISRYGIIDVINQVIAAFFFGVFFGSLLLRTNNLFILGIIHGLINFVFQFRAVVKNNIPEEPKYINTFSDVIVVILRYSLVFLPLFFIGFFLIRRRTNLIVSSGQSKESLSRISK